MKGIRFVIPIVSVIIIISALFIWRIGDNKLTDTPTGISADTIKAKQYIKLADSIRNSTPDTALIFYNKALDLLQPIKKGFWENQILTSAYVGMAFTYSQIGDNEVAIDMDSIALSKAEETNNQLMMAKALNIKALIFARNGELKQALTYYSESYKISVAINDLIMQAKISSNMAQVNSFLGDYEKTIEGFTRALEIGKQLKNNELIAGCYMNLGVVYNDLGDYEKSLKNYEESLSISLKNEDKNGELLCYQNIGGIYFHSATYDKAIDYFQRSLDIALVMNDMSNMAMGYHNLAEIYAILGDTQTATDFYFKSVKIKEEIGDKMGLVNGFLSIGTLYYQRKDLAEALQYYKKALTISQEMEYAKGIGNGFNNLASVYSSLGLGDSVLSNYSKALAIYIGIGDKSKESNVIANIGSEQAKRGNYVIAEDYILKAIQLKTEMGEVDSKAQILYNLADTYFNHALKVGSDERDRLLERAEKSGLESYQIGMQLNSQPIIHEASLTLERIYFQKGNLDNAKKFSEIVESSNDSLFSRDKTEALTFAQARWNVEKKQQEIDNLEKTKNLQLEIINQKATESRQQKIIIWFIVALLVLLVGFTVIAGIYFRKKRDMLFQKQLTNISILKMQNIRNAISPHFVFNVLNNIWAIIDDRENARAQFDNLIRLIRRSLINTDKLAIPLNEEIEFVKSYIELQKLMMNNDLKVDWNIDDKIDLTQVIPGMMIQIPVENAIKHGLAPKNDNRELIIDITANSGFLQFIISDNGIGLQKGSSLTKGTGTGLKVLTNTIYILNQSNEKKMTYEILNRNNDQAVGTKVIIKIPLQYNYNLGLTTI